MYDEDSEVRENSRKENMTKKGTNERPCERDYAQKCKKMLNEFLGKAGVGITNKKNGAGEIFAIY